MATSVRTHKRDLYLVTGKVILRESRVGVPHLLVTLYNTSSTRDSPEVSKDRKSNDETGWNRMASVITNNQGAFDVIYNPENEMEKSRRRFDILLTVSPAEDNCISSEKQQRNIAKCIRHNAAPNESFLILVEEKELEALGIHLQNDRDRVESMMARQRAARENKARFEEETRKIVAERLEKMRENQTIVESKFSKFLSAISAVPHERRNLPGTRFVSTGTSVRSANKEVMQQNIEKRINGAIATAGVMLTESQAALFKDANGEFLPEIPPSQIESLMRPNNNSRGPALVAIKPRLIECYMQPRDPCTTILDDSELGGNGHNGEATECVLNIAARTNDSSANPIPELSVALSDPSRIIVDGFTPLSQKVDKGTPLTIVARDNGQYTFAKWEDSSTSRTRTITPNSGATQLLAYYNVTPESGIPALVGNLVNYMTSPESSTIFRIQNRAGIEEIQNGVNTFSLHSGPADVPAFYYFHHLKIAFEHVWQELFDDDIINQGKKLYTELVELGFDPNEYLFTSGETDIGAINNTIATNSVKINKAKAEADETLAVETLIPSTVTQEFAITQEIWSSLSLEIQKELLEIADQIIAAENEYGSVRAEKERVLSEGSPLDEVVLVYDHVINQLIVKIDSLRKQGETIMLSAPTPKLQSPEDKFAKYHKTLEDLGKSLKESYRFSIYAANGRERSINFGIIASYRQKWEPVNYQVGQLVKTIPLAPKEIRKFSKTVTVKKSRAEKEVENNLYSRKTEASETTRAEKEIIQKAQSKTNFKLSAEGGVNIEIANAKASSEFAKEASVESQEVKKEFRESVFKAAEEYKSERTVEVNVTTGEEVSHVETGEISNPNDEIPVTYLFYELQRRFRISEMIHRVMPVILVAQEFPKPSDIDEDWIIGNDWILRRVILDDSFLPGLNYVTSKVIGDEFSLQEMYENIQQQRLVIGKLEAEVVELKGQLATRYGALQSSIEGRARAMEEEEGGGGLLGWTLETTFGGGSSTTPEAMQAREDAARDAYERVAKQEKDLQERLGREVTALNALTEIYTKNLSDHLNRRAQISRLKIHIKSNIMYYMQAIWSHEMPDQRFFRLHEVSVPKLTGKMTYKLETDQDAVPMPPTWTKPQKLSVKCKLDPDFEFQTLEEVADLDNLLGFKGNYMMFPLKESNVLTDFMMTPYFDPTTIIRDPDPLAQWTLAEFSEYVCCLHHNLTKEEFDRRIPGLKEAYRMLMGTSDADGDDIIVPTGSLFIEALPGAHPILEDFKLMHRVIDVKKAKADVRSVELENIRKAARILSDKLEDPDIEKKVVIDGGNSVIVSPDDHP